MSTKPTQSQPTPAVSDDHSSASAIDRDALPRASEIERLRLQALLLQRQLCEAQLKDLIQQYLQTAQVREVQSRIDSLTREANALAQKVFIDNHVEPTEYQFDINSGQFSRRPRGVTEA